MITHVVSFRWKPGTTPDQVAAISAGLSTLPDAVASIRSYRHGVDVGAGTGNFDYSIVATFDDVDGWREYDEHPTHVSVRTDIVRPHIAERAAVQFES
ncbi:MAG: Dabb family protein [Ilumatobacteraceae bacterium]